VKALTLRTPWAWAVCYGKPLENRTWEPRPSELRPGDRFAIHAGKLAPIGEIQEAFAWMFEQGLVSREGVPTLAELRAASGAIVALATYGGAFRSHPSPWFVGPIGLLLLDVSVLATPVLCRGFQGLWTIPLDALARVEAQNQSGSSQ
jgi:hypothetical protein